jgi:hypothetical protein
MAVRTITALDESILRTSLRFLAPVAAPREEAYAIRAATSRSVTSSFAKEIRCARSFRIADPAASLPCEFDFESSDGWQRLESNAARLDEEHDDA